MADDRIDRTVVRKLRLAEPSKDYLYWLKRSAEDRLRALDSIRKEFHGWDDDSEFRSFVELLNEHGVLYLIVGGYAVALHGYPRYTKDLDVWVEVSPLNARRIISALHAFGFGSVGLTESDFLEPDQVIQLGYPPKRVDLTTGLSGVEFAECHARKVVLDMNGVAIPFISREDLKQNKAATGRNQDKADLDALG